MRIALITGSSKGLGLEIAKKMAVRDCQTIITGRSQAHLDRAIYLLGQNIPLAFAIDFTKPHELERLYAFLLKEKLSPDMIIHSLGGRIEGDSFPLSSAVLRKSLQFNLEIAASINEHYLPSMVEKKFGRIVHISSDASLTGRASPSYVIAKAALNGYVKSAASFYAKYNIMICAVLPGIFEHENSVWAEKKISQPDYYHKRLQEMPLGRFGHPHEVAHFVADVATSDNMMCAGSLFELRGGL